MSNSELEHRTTDDVADREVHVRQLPSGYWHVRGAGPCNFSQPPNWPCDAETIRKHAHPEASDEFIQRAARVATLISAGRAPTQTEAVEKLRQAEKTAFACPPEVAKGTCEPFEDPRSHDFQGWVEFDEGRGGTTVCTRCGISAFSHSMRYAP